MASFFRKPFVRITLWVTLAVLAVIVIVEAVYLNRTYSVEEMSHAVVQVEHQTGYVILADGKETLYFTEFSDDSLLVGLDTLESASLRSDVSTGVWMNEWSFVPSCNGTILSYDFAPDVDSIAESKYSCFTDILKHHIAYLQSNVKHIEAVQKELGYYLSVHNMMDGEFTCVSDYATKKSDERDRCMYYLDRLRSVCSAKRVEVRPVSKYIATANDENARPLACVKLPFVAEDEKCVSCLQYKDFGPGAVLLQVKSLLLPDVAYAVSLPMFTEFEYQMRDTVYVPKFGKSNARRISLDAAFANLPMFSQSRRFLGFTPESCHHVGENDTLGYKFISKCDVDSLVKGTFSDSTGTYVGQMTYDGVPNGVGEFMYANGAYYEGEWVNGVRHGNGFYTMAGHMVKAGEWKDDGYCGERMVYNSHRVYGIDVSRYQHEIGRRRYGIDWKNLRITYLGAKNSGDASDTINYPVSFVYIKSTQGTTIKSKYYAADAKAARRNGILCGAYHFYSVKSRAIDQANYFLKNTQILASDMPPVLDVEPSDREIAKGGGEKKLFEEIRTWMNRVEAKTGKRPILYVSQRFIREHLSKAPDICSKYQVWIARYGAYRPEVKLLFWQLTPFGRVKGIQGDVDINVFNGYREQFEEYRKSL